MARALEKSRRALEVDEPAISGPHVNADGTIDGELRVKVDPKKSPIKQFRRLAANAPFLPGAWLSTQLFFESELEEVFDTSDFLHRRGLAGIPIHPVRAGSPKGVVNTITARLVAEKVYEGSGMRPSEIVVRLHWDPRGKRPRYK